MAVLVGLLLNLDRNEWFVAISFGVLIDLDHIFALPQYVSHNGAAAILRPTWDDGTGFAWKSSFHHSDGSFVVGYLSVGWRLLLPFVFWGVHLSMDYLQLAILDYSTAVESVLFSSAVAGTVYVLYARWHATQPDAGVRDYFVHVKSWLMNPLG